MVAIRMAPIAAATAFAAIDQPDPTATIAMPLSAGPTSAPRWKMDALRLIAFRSCRGPTISLTNTERDGLSSSCTMPMSATST